MRGSVWGLGAVLGGEEAWNLCTERMTIYQSIRIIQNIHEITVQLTALIYGRVWARGAACLHLVVVLSITLPRPLRSTETASLLRNQICVVHLSAPGTDRTSISKPAYGWPSAFWLPDPSPNDQNEMKWQQGRSMFYWVICSYLLLSVYLFHQRPKGLH